MVLQSLADNQVVVDVGSGNMNLDDPCIIRMDVKLTPYVDVVGDAHHLPFKPASVDFVFALAVFEHLRQPFRAAEEIYAALKPGGYVYGECSFLFAYHGFPDHYFNASLHGLEQVFAAFRKLRLGVAPYQAPSFALLNILSHYLMFFQPETEGENVFAALVQRLLEFPLHHYDTKLAPDTAFRLAAGAYFLGAKQPAGEGSTLPAPVLDAYWHDADLQRRYPVPHDLSVPDNLMMWAKGEGRRTHPAIEAYFAGLAPFSKHGDGSRAGDRSKIWALAPIPHPDFQRIENPEFDRMEAQAATGLHGLARARQTALNLRGMWPRVVRVYRQQGLAGLLEKAVQVTQRAFRGGAP
jgi:SAM-dependent methyltransferase